MGEMHRQAGSTGSAKETPARPRFALRQLIAPQFLRELHHFLWTEPCMVNNQVDAGWNCRDHAWTLSFLLQFFGIESIVAHGEAFFAAGPTAKQSAISYVQAPHSWLVIRTLGAIDLSIKPCFMSADDRYSVPIKFVFLGNAAPAGCDTLFFSEDSAYRKAVDRLPAQRNRIGAAYLFRQYESLGDEHFRFAAGWIGSSLARLLGTRDNDPSWLYAALLRHLINFIQGRTRSLAALPFRDAWSAVAAC